jgi:hypothetical protein
VLSWGTIGKSAPILTDITIRKSQAICLVQGRLSKEEFAKLKTLWQPATAEVRLQRRIRDRIQERQRTRFLAQAQVLYQPTPSKERYLSLADTTNRLHRRVKPLKLQHGCYHCGYGQMGGIPAWYAFCPCCHKPLNQEKTGSHVRRDIIWPQPLSAMA